jgi:hypothetical protein
MIVTVMNPDIIGAGIRLEPGMAEGGAYKRQRDVITLHVAPAQGGGQYLGFRGSR